MYAKELGYGDITGANGWLSHWLKRYNARLRSLTGEDADVDTALSQKIGESSCIQYVKDTRQQILLTLMKLVCFTELTNSNDGCTR